MYSGIRCAFFAGAVVHAAVGQNGVRLELVLQGEDGLVFLTIEWILSKDQIADADILPGGAECLHSGVDRQLNELFGSETFDQGQLVYVRGVIMGNPLESTTLQQQAANHTEK